MDQPKGVTNIPPGSRQPHCAGTGSDLPFLKFLSPKVFRLFLPQALLLPVCTRRSPERTQNVAGHDRPLHHASSIREPVVTEIHR